MCNEEVLYLLYKSAWLAILLCILLVLPVYGSTLGENDQQEAVHAYNPDNLFYADEPFGSD